MDGAVHENGQIGMCQMLCLMLDSITTFYIILKKLWYFIVTFYTCAVNICRKELKLPNSSANLIF